MDPSTMHDLLALAMLDEFESADDSPDADTAEAHERVKMLASLASNPEKLRRVLEGDGSK